MENRFSEMRGGFCFKGESKIFPSAENGVCRNKASIFQRLTTLIGGCPAMTVAIGTGETT